MTSDINFFAFHLGLGRFFSRIRKFSSNSGLIKLHFLSNKKNSTECVLQPVLIQLCVSSFICGGGELYSVIFLVFI